MHYVRAPGAARRGGLVPRVRARRGAPSRGAHESAAATASACGEAARNGPMARRESSRGIRADARGMAVLVTPRARARSALVTWSYSSKYTCGHLIRPDAAAYSDKFRARSEQVAPGRLPRASDPDDCLPSSFRSPRPSRHRMLRVAKSGLMMNSVFIKNSNTERNSL